MEIAYLLLAGIIGGFFAGLLGIGGGIIYIAILPYVLRPYFSNPDELVAAVIANSILATFFAAVMAVYRQYKNQNYFFRQYLYIGIPGAIVSIVIFKFIVAGQNYSFQAFNIFIIAILLFLLIRHFFLKKSNAIGEKKMKPWNYLFIGSSGGILSSLSGLGGGAIVVPLLLFISRMDIKKATSISMGFILISSLLLSLYNFIEFGIYSPQEGSGLIVLQKIVPLIIGVILSAQFGVATAKRITSSQLTIVFIVFVLLVMASRINDLIG